jgi:hypothetical protein
VGLNVETVGLVLVGGLLLWWMIKSDLKKMAFQERMREENAKRDALMEADRREAEAIRRKSIRPNFQPDIDLARDGRVRLVVELNRKQLDALEERGYRAGIEPTIAA